MKREHWFVAYGRSVLFDLPGRHIALALTGASNWLMCASFVSLPVATTTPVARPDTTMVRENVMLLMPGRRLRQTEAFRRVGSKSLDDLGLRHSARRLRH
jgi:hypothetical protein